MRIGIRLWLTAAFAAVSLITAAAVYFFGDKPQALIAAVVIGILAGLLIAVAISHRVVGLARAAGEMAGGSFDAPLKTSGPDEIGDLARALDSMRASLKESFGVLTADRNKLAAIFDGLPDAVVVVDFDGPPRWGGGGAFQGPVGFSKRRPRPHPRPVRAAARADPATAPPRLGGRL